MSDWLAMRIERCQLGWVIDVCATCGAHATWPFPCGHHRADAPWTVPVSVKPTGMGRRALLKPPPDRVQTEGRAADALIPPVGEGA